MEAGEPEATAIAVPEEIRSPQQQQEDSEEAAKEEKKEASQEEVKVQPNGRVITSDLVKYYKWDEEMTEKAR